MWDRHRGRGRSCRATRVPGACTVVSSATTTCRPACCSARVVRRPRRTTIRPHPARCSVLLVSRDVSSPRGAALPALLLVRINHATAALHQPGSPPSGPRSRPSHLAERASHRLGHECRSEMQNIVNRSEPRWVTHSMSCSMGLSEYEGMSVKPGRSVEE